MICHSLIALILLSAISSAQECTQYVLTTIAREDMEVVRDLQDVEVRVKVGGADERITELRPAAIHPKVFLLLDRSGSMKMQRSTELFLAGAVLKDLPADVAVAAAVFNDQYTLVSNFDTDHDRVADALSKVLSKKDGFSGRTAFASSLVETLARFPVIESGDSIVIISDAVDNRSKIDLDKALKRVAQSSLRFFIFNLVDLVRGTPEELRGPETASNLAGLTGGTYMTFFEPPENGEQARARLFTTANQVVERITSPQELRVTLPSSSHTPLALKVSVKAASGAKKPHLHAEYPAKLAPCPEAGGSVSASTQP